MSKKKQTDQFDNEFDFGDDDDFSFDDFDKVVSADSKPKKDRGVVSDVFTGTISGMKSKFTDPEFIGEGIRKSMPKSYDYFIETADEAARNLSATYNEAVKELKPQVASIASNLNKVIPEHLTAVKKLSNKFDKFMNGEPRQVTSPENVENQLVSNTLTQVFGMQDKKADEERAADKADQKVKDVIEDKRFRSTAGILGRIADYTSRSTSLQESIGISYMKKSLELQVRQLFTLQNLTDKSVKFQEVAARQYESIVKNTSLPEFVKLQESERFKQLAKDKFYGNIQGNLLEMTGLGKMAERMKKDASGFIAGAKNGLMATNDGLEMIRDQLLQLDELKESGINITKAEILGQMLGGSIANKARGTLADSAKEALSKNANIDKTGNRASTYAINAGGYAKRFRSSPDFKDKRYDEGITGKLYTALNYILETAENEGGDFKLKDAFSVSSLDKPGVITNKFIRSVEEVIPTWLAHIHRELQITRTGDASIQPSRFDFTKGEIISKDNVKKKISDRLKKDTNNFMYDSNVNSTYKNFVGEANYSPEVEKEIKSFVMRLSREKNVVYDSKGISETKHFQNLSPEAKKEVSELLKKYQTDDDSLEKSRNELQLTADMVSTRRSTTDIRATIEELIKTYGMDTLLEEGLIEYDVSGALKINEEKYFELVEEGYFATSDRNKKKNIKPFLSGIKSRFAVSDVNVKENIKTPKGSFLDKIRNTGVFSWMYKDGEGDENKHLGPMAQDVKKNMGEEAAPGGKKIDLVNLNGINMAATQELANKVDNGLVTNAESLGYAKTTSETLVEILSILKDKKHFTIGLPEGIDFGKLDPKGIGKKIITKGKEAISNSYDIASTGAKGLYGAAKGTANWFKDVLFSPALKFINDDKTKEKITETIGDIATNTMKMGSFLVKQMSTTVTKRIPEAFKKIKNTAKKLLDTIYDGIIETPDLYIKGREEAVILINRLKAGEYRDSITNKVLETLKDIQECKGDILDKSGKIVVTAKEAADGFIDRFGNTVKRKAVNAMQFAMGVGTKIIGAGFKLAKNLGQRAGKFLGLTDGRFENLKDAMSDAFKDLNFSGFTPASNTAILDIRDLLFKLHPKEALEVEKQKNTAKGDDNKRHKGIIASVKNLFKKLSKDEKEGKKDTVGTEVTPSEQQNTNTDNSSQETPETQAATPGKGKLGNLVGKAKEYFNTKNEDGSTKGEKLKEGASKFKDKLLGSKMGQAAKGRFSRLGKLASKIPGSGKVGKLAGFAKGKIGGLLGGAMGIASSFFGGGSDESQENEQVDDTNNPQEAKSYKSGKSTKSVKKTGVPAFNDKDGNGRREGSFEDRYEEANKEKEERLKKKALEKGEMKHRSKGNIIDRLMGMFASSFGTIAEGATKLISGFLGKGGLLAKSLGWLKKGKLFTKLMGLGKILGIGGAIAGGAGALDTVADAAGTAADVAGMGSKGAKATTVATKAAGKASMLSRVATFGRGLLGLGSAASTAASVAGTVGGASGAAGAATAATGAAAASTGAAAGGGLLASAGAALLSPLGLGVLAVGAVVGGYYLYKYLTRNSVDDFEEVRMYQYGFGHTKDSKDHYGKLLALEAYLQDDRTGYTKEGTYIIQKKIKPEDLYDFFKVDPQDQVKLNEFNEWFTKRFVPVYLYHTKTLYEVNNKAKIDNISSLKNNEILKYLESASFESCPYNVTASPIKDITVLNTDPNFAKNKVDEIRKKYQERSKGREKLSPGLSIREREKKAEEQLKANPVKPVEETKPAREEPKRAPLASTSNVPSVASQVGVGEDGPQMKLGDGKAAPDTSASIAYKPSSIPEATGNLKDGSAASSFMKFSSKGVSIETMNPEMKKRFLGMIQEYGELTGKSITVNSGTRTTEQQAALYRQNPAKAAKPGRSLHEFGLAVDINSSDADILDSMGLMRKYGFTRPVGGETWHVEPVGIQGKIGEAKANSSLASSLVAAGQGYGGGGIGSIKGSKLGARDPNASAAVLAASSKAVTNKEESTSDIAMPPKAIVPDTKTESTSVASAPSPLSPTSTSTSTSVSNRSSASNSFISTSGSTPTGAPTVPPSNVGDTILEPEPKPASSPGTTDPSKATSGGSKATGLEAAIEEGSKKTGMDPNMMKAFAAVESSMNPNAAARGTSAKGLYQFLDGTWNEQIRKNGKKYGFEANASRFDPFTSTVIAGEYLKTNLNGLKSVKKDTNIVDAYLTHFLGPGGARTFLSADPNASAADVMPSAAKANTNIFYNGGKPRTISEVYQFLKDKIMKKAQSFGISLGSVGSLAGNKPAGNKDGELGIDGQNSGAPSSPGAPAPTGPAGAPVGNPNKAQAPSFAKIESAVDTQPANQSSPPSRDTAVASEGMPALIDINNKQLQVFTQMFEFLKSELPKLGNNKEIGAPSTPRVQDEKAAQPAAPGGNNMNNLRPSNKDIPAPSVNVGRRPFA